MWKFFFDIDLESTILALFDKGQNWKKLNAEIGTSILKEKSTK